MSIIASQKGIEDSLRAACGDAVLYSEPMNRHTYFKTGGIADIFVRPATMPELIETVQIFNKHSVPFVVIGGGSNLLVKDTGIRGGVVCLSKLREEPETETKSETGILVRAFSGVATKKICAYAIKRGLSGMNFAIGIPGTLGGAVAMNAGTGEGEMKDVVEDVTIIDRAGEMSTLDRSSMHFSYRHLDWPKTLNDPVIAAVTLRLEKDDAERLKKEAESLLMSRNKKQPISFPSAGSVFKNPSSEYPAGKLIEEAGLKGKRIGGAQISEQHANFIVNCGGAVSEDILALIEMIQETVYSRSGFMLETEIRVLGG